MQKEIKELAENMPPHLSLVEEENSIVLNYSIKEQVCTFDKDVSAEKIRDSISKSQKYIKY